MRESEILTSEQFTDVLNQMIQDGDLGEMSHQSRGKWHIAQIKFLTATNDVIHLEGIPEDNIRLVEMEINQPVCINIQKDQERYIFESIVLGYETTADKSGHGRIILERPDRVEKLQRRAYNRIDVPLKLNVNALLWHRGYTDDTNDLPIDDHWQGKLINVSAGGAMVHINCLPDVKFRRHQVLGLQFTPLPHEKPFTLEGQIIHLTEFPGENKVGLGMEFLGLEAQGEPREILHRIQDIVETYEKMNTKVKSGVS